MQRILRKVFGIYPGEGITTFRFARFSTYWAFSTLCLESLADGLFLQKIGAKALPGVYLTIALILILISSIIVYALRIVSPYQILKKVVLSGALLTGVILFILSIPSPPIWFWYSLKVFSRLFFSVFLACGWTFIDQYHDLQEAKRVYSLYSAAYFLGIVLSGAVINLLLEKLGYSVLYTIALSAILLSFFEMRNIVEKVPAVHDDTIEGVFTGDRSGFSVLIRLVKKSPYTLVLLGLSLLVQFIMITTEFNYMEIFQTALSKDASNTAAHISGFLAKTRAAISAGNILIGAFLFSPLIRRLGLNNILLIPPIFFAFVYFGMLTQNSLFIGILGLIAVDGVLFTIEDNSFNLLTKAVPAKLKSKVRIINDSFFEPIGMLICSAFLFCLEDYSRLLGLIFSFLFLTLALLLRNLYVKAIFINLKENAIHFERKLQDWLGKLGKKEAKEIKKDLLKSLSSLEEEERLLGIEGLLAYEDPILLKRILPAAETLSETNKIAFLVLIEKSALKEAPSVLEKINNWIEEASSSELFEKAYFFLAKKGLLHPEKVIDDLESKNPFLRGAAILTLKKSQAPQSAEQASLNRTIAQKETDLLLRSENPSEILLGLKIAKEIFESDGSLKIFPLLNHANFEVKKEASLVLSQIVDKSSIAYLPKLIEEIQEIKEGEIRKNCLIALGKIGDSTAVQEILEASVNFRPSERRLVEQILLQMGLKTVPTLLSLVRSKEMHYICRIQAAKILAHLSLPQLRAHLDEIISVEKEKAYFSFFYAHTIQKIYPEYDLHLLKEALNSRFQASIDFIIHLLGTVGSIEDSELLVLSLHSKNEKVHSNAIETLEKTCDFQVFSWLFPLIEKTPLEDKLAAFEKYYHNHVPLSLQELLYTLYESPSLSDKIIAAHLKATLKVPNWKETLREQMKTNEEAFYQFAHELLER